MIVSVIIPTYKRPTFLKNAIESVLNQTYKDLELIVVSDNEKDDVFEHETRKIVEQYRNDNRLIYLEGIGNQGACYSRNRGLKSAKGAYVNFLDDDDILLPTKIERQIALIKKRDKKPAVVGCYAAIKNADGHVYRIERPEYDKNYILFSQLKKNISTTSINLINRDVCLQAGGFQYIESSQEHLFLIRIFDVDPTYDHVDEVLVEIYQHNGARVSNSPRKPLGALKLSKYIEEYYPRLEQNQIKEVQYARCKADALAYAELNEFGKAKRVLKERIRLQPFDIENVKLLILIIRAKIKRGEK